MPSSKDSAGPSEPAGPSHPAGPSTAVQIDRDDEIVILRLNRPDRLNAFTHEMGEEIKAALEVTDADDSVRAVVITGNGRAFCAGADLSLIHI